MAVPMTEPASVMSEAPARRCRNRGDRRLSGRIDDDVERLEVAVDHPVVGEARRLEDLADDGNRLDLASGRR